MKKGQCLPALCYLHPNLDMNPETVELLRAATIQALQNKQDIAACELFGLINPEAAKALPAGTAPALPASTLEVAEGAAHDYHYWMRFVRERFIPFMTSSGRLRFTSHELFSWLENCQQLALTTGDMEEQRSDGRVAWRNGVSNALSLLKQQGILKAPAFGKEYEICRTLSPAPRRPALDSLKRVDF